MKLEVAIIRKKIRSAKTRLYKNVNIIKNKLLTGNNTESIYKNITNFEIVQNTDCQKYGEYRDCREYRDFRYCQEY